MRLILHYVAALIILILYGARVCPFLETLTPLQLGGPIAAALAVQWSLQLPLRQRLVDALAYERQVRRRLMLEFGLFLLSGVSLMIFNTIHYGFPLESGLKVLIGFAVAGFFISVDLALEHERELTDHFRTSGETLPAAENCYPVSRKLALFAAVSAILVTTVLFLLVNKDLLWLLDVSATVTLKEAQVSILKEFLFVSLVILGYVLIVIRSYTRNLHFFFEIENEVLVRTNNGDLNGWVPISTNDEFGIMAHHTNRMVDAIRERTEEIGIFRAIGFRKRHVMRIIFLEAGIVSGLAGILGYILGIGGTHVGLRLFSGNPAPAVPINVELVVGAILTAIVVGMASSAYPAVMASRLDPNEALRAL